MVLPGFSEEAVELWNLLNGLRSCLDSLKRGQKCRTCSGDCGPVWHGQSSVCASPIRHMCWSRPHCPVLRQQKMVVSWCRSRRWIGSFRLSGTGWNVRLMMGFVSLKRLECCGGCSLLPAFAKESACSFPLISQCRVVWFAMDVLRSRRATGYLHLLQLV